MTSEAPRASLRVLRSPFSALRSSRALRVASGITLAVATQACDTENGLLPHGFDPDGSTIQAHIVAVDESNPALEGLSHVEGSVELEDIMVELWDGTAWQPVVDRLSAATLTVGDAAIGTDLFPTGEIPAGTYSRVRVTVARGTAALAVTVDGERYGMDATLADGPMVVEKDVAVTDVAGVRTFRIGLETVRDLTHHTEADGSVSVLMAGDLGGGTLPLTAVVVSDGSDPQVDGLTELDGKVLLEGVKVELLDDAGSVVSVVDRDAVGLHVADLLTPTPLLTGRDTPASGYSRIRISADRVWAGLKLELNDQEYGGEALLGEAVVVEKDLATFTLHGAQVFWMVLETVQAITPETADDGSQYVVVEGDLGVARIPLRSHPNAGHTAVVASDGSDPQHDALTELEGRLRLEGIKLELGDGTTWRTVVEHLDGARFEIGEVRKPTVLLPPHDLSAGGFTHARLSVRRASAAIAMFLGDHKFSGEVLLGEAVVVEKNLELVDGDDDWVRALWMVLETVKTITRQTADDGSVSVLIEGDFGDATLSGESREPPHTGIVVSDGSDPEIDALHELKGKTLLQGITLDVWDGANWRTVVENLEEATLDVGGVREATPLLRTDDLPAADYRRARITVRRASARLLIHVGDHWFGGEAVLGEGVVLEKELKLLEESDHNARILWMVLETVQTLSRQTADDGSPSLLVEGELGSASLAPLPPPDAAPAAVVASDGSDPETDGLGDLEGKATIEGAVLELHDGTEWLTVADIAAADIRIADVREPTGLFRSDDLAAGEYGRARLTVRRASARIALKLGDRLFGGEVILGEGVVVEKPLEVIERHDALGAHFERVFWMVMETVKTITRQTADDGSLSVVVEGDLGRAILPEITSHGTVGFEVIDRVHTTEQTPITDRLRAVIRSLEEWEQFWNEYTAGIAPQPERPDVDFTQHMVVVAAMGERATGGYAIEVKEVMETDAGLAVHVVELSPGATCMVSQAATAPVTAVVLPWNDGAVEFVEHERTDEC